jgi:hypothetical protein
MYWTASSATPKPTSQVFRPTMAPEAFAAARQRAATRLLRERIGLPVIAFE